MSKTPIADAFAGFMKASYPEPIGDDQTWQIRCAFYGGALSHSRVLLTEMAIGEEITDQDVGLYEAIEQEFSAFSDEIEAWATAVRGRGTVQ